MKSPTVYIVDDDIAIRDSLSFLCESADLDVESYDSAESFLQLCQPELPGCLVLDVRMEQMSGPELHAELNRRCSPLPVIFLTGHGDIPMTVRAIKAGADDFLTKPVNGALLLKQVLAALNRSAGLQRQRETLMLLTPREHEVMLLALAGHPNKTIATRMGISHRTVEIHRSRIFQKTGVTTLLELTRFVADCRLHAVADADSST